MTREKFENRLRACCCARRGAFVRLAQPTHGSKLVKHMVFILKEIRFSVGGVLVSSLRRVGYEICLMSNADASRIHEQILRTYQTRTLVGEDGAGHKLRPGAVSYERGEFIAQMISRAGATRTVETGCWLRIVRALHPQAIVKMVLGPARTSSWIPSRIVFFRGSASGSSRLRAHGKMSTSILSARKSQCRG